MAEESGFRPRDARAGFARPTRSNRAAGARRNARFCDRLHRLCIAFADSALTCCADGPRGKAACGLDFRCPKPARGRFSPAMLANVNIGPRGGARRKRAHSSFTMPKTVIGLYTYIGSLPTLREEAAPRGSSAQVMTHSSLSLMFGDMYFPAP